MDNAEHNAEHLSNSQISIAQKTVVFDEPLSFRGLYVLLCLCYSLDTALPKLQSLSDRI